MKYKKVSGERVAAAIIDSILVGIVESIPLLIYIVLVISEQGFTDAINSILFGSPTGAAGTTIESSVDVAFQLVTYLSSLVVGIVYFAFVPFRWNGQTLGKKLLKIKAVNEFGDNLSFKQHFIRAIQVWSAYVGALTLILLVFNVLTFAIVSAIIQFIVSGIVFVSAIMVLARSDGKGIHDLMAGSSVVPENTDFNAEFIQQATKNSDWADVVLDKEIEENDDWLEPKKSTTEDDDEWKI